MTNPPVPPPTPPAQPSADGTPVFYWEYDEPQRSRLQALALLDEGYLATELNRGNRMLAVPRAPQEVPDLDQLAPANPDLYEDAISNILQVAAWQGLDLNEICDTAIEQVDAMLSWSAGAAAMRPTE